MSQRYHALDSLRGIMMLLGVVLHSAINYTQTAIPLYFYRDSQQSLSMDLLVFVIHTFRMPTFFVMAGFFAALLFYRRGQRAMLNNRFKRIFLPFVIFWPTLFFLAIITYLLCIHFIEYNQWGIDHTIAEKYASGNDKTLSTMHLWFLYYLIQFYLLLIPLVFILQKMPSIVNLLDRSFAFLLRSSVGPILFTLPLAIAGYFYSSGMVTIDASFIPDLPQILYHGIFFVTGWYLYKNQQLIQQYRQHWWLYSLLAVLTMLITLGAFGFKQQGHAEAHYFIAFFTNLSTWLCVFALIGLFERFLADFSATRRYLTDSSYWVYLAHTLFTMGFAVAIKDLTWPAELKCLLVCALAAFVCFVSYHYCVRSTLIGQFLNGRKY